MSNTRWLQLLKCEYLMLFFVISDSKWNIFGFWIVGRINQEHWIPHLGPLEIKTLYTKTFFLFSDTVFTKRFIAL